MQQAVVVEVPGLDLPASFWHRATKRSLDVAVALVVLLLLTPVLLICALLVMRSSPGPILFRQERVGAQGRRFVMFKFRSMVAAADHGLHREYIAAFIRGDAEQQVTEEGALYKIAHDPRVTRAGQFLRRTSLDELPQLFNVLRGEMSLVGPRPPIPYELEHYRPEQLRRLAVKPGITGLWQVSGRNQTTFDEMVDLDLEYIRRSSIWTDLAILFRTIPIVFGRGNAR